MKRFWTADFHLGMSDILRFEKRGKQFGGPFDSIEDMNKYLLNECKKKSKDDIIIHVGDLASFKIDRNNEGLSEKPSELIKSIDATFVNIRGNHDSNNRVKSLCESMRIHLGKKYPDVSVSHYPSYDIRAEGHFKEGDIHICGHVHKNWKHCLDLKHKVLNINVGVDANNYKLLSDEDLIKYLDSLLKLPLEKIYKI